MSWVDAMAKPGFREKARAGWNRYLSITPVDPLTAPTRRPTMLDIAWAAGIWEGEGHISKDARACGYGRGMIISVTQKDTEILHRLKELFGGAIRKRNTNDCSIWQLTGPRGHGFIMTIFSFLSKRRKEQVLSRIAERKV